MSGAGPRVLVFGAGAIGGFLGGGLLASGLDVTFLVRDSVARRFEEHGLELSDYRGERVPISSPIPYIKSMSEYRGRPDVVLLTVKCTGLVQAAQELAPHVAESSTVVCLQNGVGNKDTVAAHLPSCRIVSGMVPFQVLNTEAGRLHRGTEGRLQLEEFPQLKDLLVAWNRVGIPASRCENYREVAWGKLLLNLNNAINGLAGVPLVEELSQRSYRRVLSASQRELLRALKTKGLRPAKLTKAPAWLIPWILLLPDWLFRVVAQQMLAIDPEARSSLWEDLERRRPTEIDYLNGAVLSLAEESGLPAPVNRAIIALVKDAEKKGSGSPQFSGDDLARRLLGNR